MIPQPTAPGEQPEKKWNSWETYCMENIICPHCNYEHEDSWEHTEDEPEFRCADCDKIFSMTRDVTVSYTTTPTDE